MLIALPNTDGTFTCTLFLNYSGDPSFEGLRERSDVETFFESNFPDAMAYLERPVDVFMEKTASPLFLVQVFPWSFNCKVALIGDAAHAIVPFYGPAYENARKPNGDAIAELSKRNFVEMSDLSGDPMFQLRKKIEAKFHAAHPDIWTPLYSMVTFSPEVPYAEALRVGDVQKHIMDQVMQLPEVESDWDEPYVMDQLYKLATAYL
jgi:kynurenine 3-monooxygenase